MILFKKMFKWNFRLLAVYISFTSCNTGPRSIPFPEDENSDIQVSSKSFAYGKTEQISWIDLNEDSLKRLRHTSTFDLKGLEQSKLINSETRPMQAPADEKKLEWDTTVY